MNVVSVGVCKPQPHNCRHHHHHHHHHHPPSSPSSSSSSSCCQPSSFLRSGYSLVGSKHQQITQVFGFRAWPSREQGAKRQEKLVPSKQQQQTRCQGVIHCTEPKPCGEKFTSGFSHNASDHLFAHATHAMTIISSQAEVQNILSDNMFPVVVMHLRLKHAWPCHAAVVSGRSFTSKKASSAPNMHYFRQ